MVLKLVNNGINYQPQLVQDFFHQQYLQFFQRFRGSVFCQKDENQLMVVIGALGWWFRGLDPKFGSPVFTNPNHPNLPSGKVT